MSVSGALRAATLCAFALAAVELLWEAWLAPLAPGGAWLGLSKALPLAALAARARTRRRALQWLLIFAPWYLAEALVRAITEGGRARVCAATALALAGACLAFGLAYFRASRNRR